LRLYQKGKTYLQVCLILLTVEPKLEKNEKMLALAVAGSAVAAVAVASALGVPVQKILQDAIGGVLNVG
jgi:hypothetical protein